MGLHIVKEQNWVLDFILMSCFYFKDVIHSSKNILFARIVCEVVVVVVKNIYQI